MNKLTLKEFNSEYLIYLYQPEGKGRHGEIEYNFAKKEASLIHPAEESSNYYLHKALLKVKEFAMKNVLPREATQAWV